MSSPTGRNPQQQFYTLLGGGHKLMIVDDLWEQADYAALEARVVAHVIHEKLREIRNLGDPDFLILVSYNLGEVKVQSLNRHLIGTALLMAALPSAAVAVEHRPIWPEAPKIDRQSVTCRPCRQSKGERKRNKRDRWS